MIMLTGVWQKKIKKNPPQKDTISTQFSKYSHRKSSYRYELTRRHHKTPKKIRHEENSGAITNSRDPKAEVSGNTQMLCQVYYCPIG